MPGLLTMPTCRICKNKRRYGGKVTAVWSLTSIMYTQHCCGTTTTAPLLATLASTKLYTACKGYSGGKVCSLISATTYTLVSPHTCVSSHLCLIWSHANAVNAQPPNLLDCCNFCMFLKVWDSVSTDFITGLSKTKVCFDEFVVFVDRLTKYLHLAPTTTKCTAQTWGELFMQHMFCNHGCLMEVISDRGPQFAGSYSRS